MSTSTWQFHMADTSGADEDGLWRAGPHRANALSVKKIVLQREAGSAGSRRRPGLVVDVRQASPQTLARARVDRESQRAVPHKALRIGEKREMLPTWPIILLHVLPSEPTNALS